MRFVLALLLSLGAVSAFAPATRLARTSVAVSAEQDARRSFLTTAAAGAAMVFTPLIAKADREYDGIKYLGGGDFIDLNNANIRAYLKLKGMYPSIAGKIVSNKVPFKSVADIYKLNFSDAEKAILKQYESKFIVLEPKPEYQIDRINNGLYR